MRYPVAPRGLVLCQNEGGSGGIRTHAFKRRLELESSALDHSATKPSLVKERRLQDSNLRGQSPLT